MVSVLTCLFAEAEAVVSTTLAYDPFERITLEALNTHSWVRRPDVGSWMELTKSLRKHDTRRRSPPQESSSHLVKAESGLAPSPVAHSTLMQPSPRTARPSNGDHESNSKPNFSFSTT